MVPATPPTRPRQAPTPGRPPGRRWRPCRRPIPSAAAPATTCPGFAVLDPAGEHVGFDADFCRVIAAAVLGDADAGRVRRPGDRRPLHRAAVRRDRRARAQHHVDGQPRRRRGRHVPPADLLRRPGDDGGADSGFTELDGLAGGVVCVAGGTTTEGNVATEFARLGLDAPRGALVRGRRPDAGRRSRPAAATAGRPTAASSPACARPTPTGPTRCVILEEVFSKEPLAPAVRDGDSHGPRRSSGRSSPRSRPRSSGSPRRTSTRAQSQRGPQRSGASSASRSSGARARSGPRPAGRLRRTRSSRQVGNYGEIFEEHLTPLGLERG